MKSTRPPTNDQIISNCLVTGDLVLIDQLCSQIISDSSTNTLQKEGFLHDMAVCASSTHASLPVLMVISNQVNRHKLNENNVLKGSHLPWSGRSPIIMAAQGGHSDIVLFLHSPSHSAFSDIAFSYAVSCGHAPTMQSMLKAGIVSHSALNASSSVLIADKNEQMIRLIMPYVHPWDVLEYCISYDILSDRSGNQPDHPTIALIAGVDIWRNIALFHHPEKMNEKFAKKLNVFLAQPSVLPYAPLFQAETSHQQLSASTREITSTASRLRGKM